MTFQAHSYKKSKVKLKNTYVGELIIEFDNILINHLEKKHTYFYRYMWLEHFVPNIQ